MKRRVVVLLLTVFLILTCSVTSLAKRNVALEESYATRLKELGLFYGVAENDFDLERAPTRIEALVMLIRVLGSENTALSGTWKHPFTDVPAWADKYVGYAYENGLANGVSLTEFGTTNATSAQYLTFMLRALGYSDTNGKDFTWDKPYELARYAMILPSTVDIDNFWRADVAHISYVALSARLKESTVTLAEKLIEAGTFTKEKFDSVTSVKLADTPQPLTTVEISEQCADAVFYIEMYSFNGNLRGSGSGFFISEDGYAITNHHVVAGGRYFTATSPDGTVYDKITVVDTYEEQDLALIKIDNSEKVEYLEFGDSASLKQGQKVYAIGSPLGLENTMSEGIISNLRRMDGEKHYMQISVPIDSGSSGGALVDEYGYVVGVTTAGITGSGSDLNFIIPIQYAEKLDKNANENTVWYKATYTDLTSVYNFGAFTGITSLLDMRETNFGYVITYDGSYITDIKDKNGNIVYTKEDNYNFCLEQYGKALIANGFTHTKKDGADYYESDSERVIISVNENKKIALTLEIKPQYYSEAPGLVDVAWYLDAEFIDKASDGDTVIYSYKWKSNWTVDIINEYFLHYINDVCRPDYTLIHSEYDKNSNVLSHLYGSNVLVTLKANITSLSVEIKPYNLVTLEKHFGMLSSYIIKNSTSSVNKKHSIISKNSEDKYMVSYDEKDGLISFAGNVKLPDTEIQAYIRINKHGKGAIEVTLTKDGKQTVYNGSIFANSFGKNIIPNQTYYNGKSLNSDLQTIVSACVTILKRCEENVLANTSLTLEKVGFENIHN